MADLLPLLARKPIATPGAFAPIADLPMPNLPAPNMGGGAPSLGPLTAPNVVDNPRMKSSAADPSVRRTGDLNAEIYGLEHPIAPTTTLGKIGHVAANVGNVLGNIFAPATMALIPGTELGNRVKIGEDQSKLQDISQQQTEADQRKQTEATTAYTQARPAIEQAKILQKLTSSLAPKGIIATMNPDGTIDTQDDPESQAFKNQQSLSEMHSATADKDAATTAIAQNKYQPGTPEYQREQTKINQADQRIHVALAGLGLRAQGLDLRRQNTNAALYGTDNQGNALPGAAQISDSNGNTSTVGSKNAGHAITQQANVGSFNDLSGSIDHTKNALAGFFNEGGTLNDPRVISALNDHNTPTAQWIGGLVQHGLSPNAIAAVSAIRQNHEQAGILRGVTKGTSAEAGAQRILETTPMPGDSNEMVMQKLAEQRNVMDRLAPGMTGVAGGVQVAGKASKAGGGGKTIRAVDPNGVLHEAPAGTPLPKGWKAQ
jgi:hypothetical protein